MKKTLIKILIILYIFIPTINVHALEINSENAVLYNLNDDNIIFEKNAYEKIKVASLTKIMTAIVALENIEDTKTQIEITKEEIDGLEEYAIAGLKIGDKITYEDLLYGLMLPSAADCANALAINIAGTIENYVELMNKKAQELNLINTHFSNPIGADEDNYSTVNEIAILLKYALKNEEFYKIFTTRNYTMTNNIKVESTIEKKSKTENIDSTIITGAKTGFTDEAGNCLASITTLDNVKYLLVTAKAPITNEYHILDALNIYNYFQTNYSYKKILNYNEYIKTLKVKEGTPQEYNVYVDRDKYMYLNNEINVDNLKYEFIGQEEISKENSINKKIGILNIKYNENIIYTYDILINENITFYNFKMYIFSLAIIVLTTLILLIKITKNK